MKIKQRTLKQPVDQTRNHKENQKYLKTNENKNTTYQDLWNKFIAINAYYKK